MNIALSVIGVTFTAVCISLGVRIVNRRERWAKWTLAIWLSLPVLYLLSFGPACWASSRTGNRKHESVAVVEIMYQPLLRASLSEVEPFADWFKWYAKVGAHPDRYLRSGCFDENCYWEN